LSPLYDVTVLRWGVYTEEADTPEEAQKQAEERARYSSSDSDTFHVETESVEEASHAA
jgi:hypothetical protein